MSITAEEKRNSPYIKQNHASLEHNGGGEEIFDGPSYAQLPPLAVFRAVVEAVLAVVVAGDVVTLCE